MSAPRDRVIEMLRAHRIAEDDGAAVTCSTCGPERWFEAGAGFAAHQADVLAAAGLVVTATQWGVRWDNGQWVGPMTKREAHAWKSATPVRRGVTEWRPADE